jgi:DNA-binding CsgD family transcriptional regulator
LRRFSNTRRPRHEHIRLKEARMSQYHPQPVWELTRAAVSVAAWFVLFYRLHRPSALWRRIALLVAMPGAYAFWIFMPMSTVGNAVSWAAITVVFALVCGDLRRSLFTAFFYIGMEASIDNTRCALVAMLLGHYFPAYSPGYYAQYNLQYLLVLAASVYYCRVMRRFAGKPPVSSWLLTIAPPFGLWAVLTYYAVLGDALLFGGRELTAAGHFLQERGINIYGPGFCFGFFSILCNLGVFWVHTRNLALQSAQALAIEVSGAEPVWTAEGGLSAAFCEKYGLTAREKNIVEELMKGKTNKEIVGSLCISLKTVETYLSNLYRKTGVSNRFALYTLIKGA